MKYKEILLSFIQEKHGNLNRFCKYYNINYGSLYRDIHTKEELGLLRARNICNKIFQKDGIRIFDKPDTTNNIDLTQEVITVKIPLCDIINNNLVERGEYMDFPVKLLALRSLKASTIKMVEINSDDMLPRYQPGEYIAVAENNKEIINNKLYLVKYDNIIYFRRIDRVGNQVILKADNPDKVEYPDKIVSPELEFEVLGQVMFKFGIAS